MTTRLSDPTTATDPVVRWVLIVTMTVTIVGLLVLIRAAAGDRVHHVTVRVDNQAGLAVQVDAADPAGDRVGLGEIPDIGASWTIIAAYGGQEVHRETLARADLADRNWTVTIPASATDALEQAGYL
jgi:catechol 2,3-dioxygenase-like lactoylglutathione lyase family enzyme